MDGLSFTPLRAAGTKGVLGIQEPTGQEALKKSAQNLLAHIPGEASGFYLMAVGAFNKPSVSTLVVVSLLAFILLVLVRWVAKASRGVMIASVLAFVIWMFVLDNGLFHVLFPDLLPTPLGLIIAVFYSAAVTTLANAGKLT